MENNQQQGSVRNTSKTQAPSEFQQERPGQELPADGESQPAPDRVQTAGTETHSESSLPQNDNETLGTP